MSRRVLSLFSGAGGMDLGLEGGFPVFAPSYPKLPSSESHVMLPLTGFQTVFANDIRPDAESAWRRFFVSRGHAASVFHRESIVDIVKKVRRQEWEFPANIDVVTGGFPCQDFSFAGKRLGLQSYKNHDGQRLSTTAPEASTENRGQLYMWMKQVIECTLPKVFIAENVKGLAQLSAVKALIEHDFRNTGGGYVVLSARVLNASHYGVPQARERVIFLGFRKNALTPLALNHLTSPVLAPEWDPYPVPTHASSAPVTCAQSLFDLPEPSLSLDPSQRIYSRAKWLQKGQGQKEIAWDSVAPTIRAEHHGNIEFRRLSSAHGGKNTSELALGLPERRLTVRECARLQTFPDSYAFVAPADEYGKTVSASKAYQLIGNAVPPLLAYHFAVRLNQMWPLYFGQSRE